MTNSTWTPARRRGLAAFDENGVARESNITDEETHKVYWQTRAWLSEHGYIEPVLSQPGYYQLRIDEIERSSILGRPA